MQREEGFTRRQGSEASEAADWRDDAWDEEGPLLTDSKIWKDRYQTVKRWVAPHCMFGGCKEKAAMVYVATTSRRTFLYCVAHMKGFYRGIMRSANAATAERGFG